MLGVQPGDTSMMAGLGLLYGGNVYGGGISSGTLHWLETSTSRYSKSDFMWKSLKKDCAGSQPLGGNKVSQKSKRFLGLGLDAVLRHQSHSVAVIPEFYYRY